MAERRIILVGKTGNGKSSTGNSILGLRSFKTGKSLLAVTTKCGFNRQMRYQGLVYAVCDTPGLFDSDSRLQERLVEIQKSVLVHNQKPHAFLLVFSSLNRLTQEEEHTIKLLQILFGEEVFDYCIIVFTRGDEFENDDEFRKFWSQSPVLVKLIRKCGDRVVRIENRPGGDISNLRSMLELMSVNGRKTYDCPHLHSHSKTLQESLQSDVAHENLSEELTKLSIDIEGKKRQEQEERRTRLIQIGGAVLSLGIGFLRYKYGV